MHSEQKKNREIKLGNYRCCKFGPHYLLAQQALLRQYIAPIYWRSAGIPILNSSADYLSPLCRVLPIRQDITYWFCFTGAETEIHKIKDDSKINIEKNINRRGQRHIVNVWHLSDPPSFSLPTTFKINLYSNLVHLTAYSTVSFNFLNIFMNVWNEYKNVQKGNLFKLCIRCVNAKKYSFA